MIGFLSSIPAKLTLKSGGPEGVIAFLPRPRWQDAAASGALLATLDRWHASDILRAETRDRKKQAAHEYRTKTAMRDLCLIRFPPETGWGFPSRTSLRMASSCGHSGVPS